MARKPSKLPEEGSSDAASIYLLVGSSLSYWEASEDALMGMFRWLCGDAEPISVESYVQAPRKVRSSMLRLALEIYGYRFDDEELVRVRQAMSQLDKLASVRNEIAHGHVSEVNETATDESGMQRQTARGNYLLPSYNERGWHERTYRFHHTAETIFAFQEAVREHRWTIIEAYSAAKIREQQEDMQADGDWYMQQRLALDVVSRKIKPSEWSKYFKPSQDWHGADL